ncbi:hypothetical protein [Pseudomonas phage Astolliot]|nr:hypothetical protein [Pseudomonas phage Astolliot]
MKEQVIAIFEAALASPAYLNPAFNLETGLAEDSDEYHEHANNWFCVIVGKELDKAGHPQANSSLADEVFAKIKQSIWPSAFLKSHLGYTGVIGCSVEYEDPEYKTAAHAHWRALIEKIRSEK